ncbi:hypothetical protein LJB42_004519 [Komagataella kurtzmanii]|nr:hypothetical protein LJB42_004519 [Komagataella kurtzmanii]
MSGITKPVNLYSVAELRNATDDALPLALSKLGYEQNFSLIDTKLAIGYVATILAGSLYYLEKKYNNDFSNLTYYYSMVALVMGYFALNGLLWLHGKYREKDIKYVGINKNNQKKISIEARVENNTTPIYKVTVIENNRLLGRQDIPFTSIFDEDGFIHIDQLVEIFTKLLQEKEK